ncbi:non-structural maintenance of chromosomes element 1 homolog isoform X2 [Belonocnema kinseyi]|nr:non-structural maintenance of chromosomes element 1 homolog isoform X2 [Belonocnema kinseyi]
MSLKLVKCEHTGQEYWMLVSSILDDSTKFQLEFNHAQLELLRKIYSEIITSNAKGISGTVCLNMCSNLENKITKHDAEEFLSEMVSRKWLYLSNGIYYMGARSIGELLLYFKCTYEDSLTNCVLCKHVIFHGHICQECHSVLHNYCLLNYAKIQKPLKCPNCSKPMPDVEIDDSQGPEETNFIGNGNSAGSDDSEEEIPQVKKRRSRRL